MASAFSVHLEAHFHIPARIFFVKALPEPPQLMDGSECITVAEFSFV